MRESAILPKVIYLSALKFFILFVFFFDECFIFPQIMGSTLYHLRSFNVFFICMHIFQIQMNRKKSLPCFTYIIYLFQPLQCFLSLHVHILDTDGLGAKLTNYTLANDNHLALIEKKLHQTNSTGIFPESIIYIHVHALHD